MIVDKICADLKLPRSYLMLLARTASHRYKTYQIKKHNGEPRTINHPARELKLLQRWIVETALSKLRVHKAATAYKKGASVYKNAALHRRRNFILKVDFKDFFPSIQGTDVVRLLESKESLLRGSIVGPDDREIVRKIVCKGNRLTIGAPSSPAISNFMMFEFDQKWANYSNKHGVVYSRYADDLYFSTNLKGVLAVLLVELRKDLADRKSPQLRVNEDKTVFTSRKRRRLVTGLVLSSIGEISLGRGRKRFIKSLVFKNSRHELTSEQSAALYGTLAYAQSVEPTFVAALRRKYGQLAIGESPKPMN